MVYPHHDEVSQDYPDLPAKDKKLADFISVARVRPRTSKGITDLLLPNFHGLNIHSPFKKQPRNRNSCYYLIR